MIVWRIFGVMLVVSVLALLLGIYSTVTATGGLQDTPRGYAFGPEDADLTVVEFLDYGCVHCREIHPIVTDAIKRDGKIRYIPRPISALPEGVYAAKVTYAAGLQNKYKEVFTALIEGFPGFNEKNLTDLVLKTGIDAEQLAKDMDSEDAKLQAEKAHKTFGSLGGQYTPTFFIGKKIKYVPSGKPTSDDFLKMFAEARGK